MRKMILIALLATAGLTPSVAMAQQEVPHHEEGDRGGWNRGGDRGQFRPQGQPTQQPQFQRPQFQAPPQQQPQQFQRPQFQPPVQPQPQPQAQPPRFNTPAYQGNPNWRGGGDRGEGWRGGDRPPVVQAPPPSPPLAQPQQGWRGDARDDHRRDGGDWNRGRGDGNRDQGGLANQGWRGTTDAQRGRDGWPGDNHWRENRDGGRGYYNDGRGYYGDRDGDRRWNNDWRRDRQYDWHGYRDYNRQLYHLPRYYAPYGWGYGYRRFSIGFTLDAILYGENYWISDPFYYRLPPAYGPYRWVRYYDDALLVNIYTGQVVDVVYDIFW
ncbi:MAG: RcnB family protein [Sphingomonas sp.]